MALDEHRRANLANWEDRVAVHLAPDGYGVDELIADARALSGVVSYDAPRLGDLTGLRVVHLQCHIGTDTLSLARMGADVTGVDFSPSAVAAAREIFARADVPGTFVEAELYDAPAVLAPQQFDLVYTGVGALPWLPDIAAWGRVVAALLAPGGRLFLREGHPVLWAVDDERTDGELVLKFPYFETGQPLRWEEETSYLGTGRLEHPTIYAWNHGLGEIVTAVLDVGLRLDALVEHDEVEWAALPQMQLTDEGRYVLPEGRNRLPLMFTLEASVPSEA